MSKSSSRFSPTPPQDKPKNAEGPAEGAAAEPPETAPHDSLAQTWPYRFALLFVLGALVLLGSSLLFELILSLFR